MSTEVMVAHIRMLVEEHLQDHDEAPFDYYTCDLIDRLTDIIGYEE
jgi:hypothetical protein